MNRWARFVVRLGTGSVFVWLILRGLDLSSMASTVAPLDAATGIAAAACLLLAGQLVAARRWQTLLADTGLRWAYLARLYLIGGFASLFLPTLVGGDALRAAAAARSSGGPAAVVTSVLLDRVVGVTAMLTYLAIGVLAAPSQAMTMMVGIEWSAHFSSLVLWGGACVFGAALVMLLRSTRVRAALLHLWNALSRLITAPRRALTALALAFVVQGLYLVLWMVLAHALALPLSASALLIAVPLVTLGGMLPITIAGLGVREGAWLVLFRESGIPGERLVAFSLCYFVANLLVGGVGGVLFVWRGLRETTDGHHASDLPAPVDETISIESRYRPSSK